MCLTSRLGRIPLLNTSCHRDIWGLTDSREVRAAPPGFDRRKFSRQFHSSRRITLLQVLAQAGSRSLWWMTAGSSSAGDAVARTAARRQAPRSSRPPPPPPPKSSRVQPWERELFSIHPMNGTLRRAGSRARRRAVPVENIRGQRHSFVFCF